MAAISKSSETWPLRGGLSRHSCSIHAGLQQHSIRLADPGASSRLTSRHGRSRQPSVPGPGAGSRAVSRTSRQYPVLAHGPPAPVAPAVSTRARCWLSCSRAVSRDSRQYPVLRLAHGPSVAPAVSAASDSRAVSRASSQYPVPHTGSGADDFNLYRTRRYCADKIQTGAACRGPFKFARCSWHSSDSVTRARASHAPRPPTALEVFVRCQITGNGAFSENVSLSLNSAMCERLFPKPPFFL